MLLCPLVVLISASVKIASGTTLRFPPRRRAREHPWRLTMAPLSPAVPAWAGSTLAGYTGPFMAVLTLRSIHSAVTADRSPRLRYQPGNAAGPSTRRAEPGACAPRRPGERSAHDRTCTLH